MFESTDDRESERLLRSSRWKFSRDKLELFRSARRLRQRDIALIMGFGNDGRSPDYAEQYLSTRLSQDQAFPAWRIMKLAAYFGVSPYEFACPVHARDMDELRKAVELLSNTSKRSQVIQLANIRWTQSLVDKLDVEPSDEFKQKIARLLDAEFYQNHQGDLDLALENELSRVLTGDELFDLYIALTRHEARHALADKRAMDATGLLSDFKSWNRHRYKRLIEADNLYAATKPSGNQSRNVARVFLVSPTTMSQDGIRKLKSTMRFQMQQGIGIRVKYCDPTKINREHMADIGAIGSWAVDFRLIEAGESNGLPLGEVFVPQSDRMGFQKLLRRMDWTNDLSVFDAVITCLEQIDELAADLAAKRLSL